MPSELCYVGAPSLTSIYARLVQRGLVWSTVAGDYVTPVVLDWANYNVSLPETPSGSGIYVADAPAGLPPGTAQVIISHQTGAAPVPADAALGLGELAWDGAAEVALTDLATLADLERRIAAGRDGLPAETYFVDGLNGNDGNDGRSWGAAKLTLGAAVALINPATATRPAIIAMGSFVASVDLSALPPVLLAGSAALMSGGSPPLTTCDGLIVRGWTIERSGAAPGIAMGGGVGIRTFEDCEIVASDGLGGIETILITRTGDTVTFRRCILYGDLDAASGGRIVLDGCVRLAGTDTGNVVYTGDIASREASGAAAAAAALIRGAGGRTLADLATPVDVKPTVLPVALTVRPPFVTIAGPSSSPFDLPQGYAVDLALRLTDSAGDALDLSGAGEIRFRVATRAKVEVFTLSTEDDSVEVTDAEEGQLTLHFTATHLATAGTYQYAFGSMVGPTPYGEGRFLVREMMGLGS